MPSPNLRTCPKCGAKGVSQFKDEVRCIKGHVYKVGIDPAYEDAAEERYARRAPGSEDEIFSQEEIDAIVEEEDEVDEGLQEIQRKMTAEKIGSSAYPNLIPNHGTLAGLEDDDAPQYPLNTDETAKDGDEIKDHEFPSEILSVRRDDADQITAISQIDKATGKVIMNFLPRSASEGYSVFPLDEYNKQFREFILMCQKQSDDGMEGVILADPKQLGGTYEEVLQSLKVLRDHGLALHLKK